MQTPISAANPFSYSRKGFAWEHVPADTRAHLDFGCYDGLFLDRLSRKCRGRMVGVDISENAVREARAKYPDLEVHRLNAAVPLPFEDQSFTSVTLLDVLEHVAPQKALLAELFRVLAPGGCLVVTVPGAHLWTFLDLGNLKFRFPALHRWYVVRRHGQAYYDQRYVANADGLIGDIAVEKAWHEHFKRAYLRELLERAGFEVQRFDGSEFWARPIQLVQAVTGSLTGWTPRFSRLLKLDARLFASKNLFCVAKRP
jgi:ubiquinone/menaquinone biosynthesis C-methylase UbiE